MISENGENYSVRLQW